MMQLSTSDVALSAVEPTLYPASDASLPTVEIGTTVHLPEGETGVVTAFVAPDKLEVELEGGQGFVVEVSIDEVRIVPGEGSELSTPPQASLECGSERAFSSAGSSRVSRCTSGSSATWDIVRYAGATKEKCDEANSPAPLSIPIPPLFPTHYTRQHMDPQPPLSPCMPVKERFPEGSWVRISGLKNDTELNGRTAEVVGYRQKFGARLLELVVAHDERSFVLHENNVESIESPSLWSPTPEDSDSDTSFGTFCM